MTPKEKAREIVDKYWTHTWVSNTLRKQKSQSMTYSAAKWCAITSVSEILNLLFQHHEIDYWKEVRKEIELL